MCQLTLTDFKNEKFNNLWLYYSLLHNTKIQHKDGFGIFTNLKDVYKSEKCPQNILNLADIIQTQNSTNLPILSHVRQISVGKVPKVEDSHPFEKENLILFHNGTLKWKAWNNLYNGIDSEQFAEVLDEELTTEKDFVKAIKKSYNKFTGKFAFLIFNKIDKKIYVVRGITAKLHIAHFYQISNKDGKEIKTNIGTVINTEYDSLKDTCSEIIDILQLTSDIIIEADIKEIKPEKIYEYNDGILKEIGDIKENFEPQAVKLPITIKDESIAKIVEILKEEVLSFYDLDEICYAKLGRGIAYLTKQELLDFTVNFVSKNLAKWNANEKRRIWSDLKLYIKDYEDYKKYDLKFPYMLNSKNTLNKVQMEILNELAEEELYRGY